MPGGDTMKKLKLKLADNKNPYSQNQQQIDMKYSFISRLEGGGFEEMFPPVLCRDYLSDCIVGLHMDKSISKIYGFSLSSRIEEDCMFSIRMPTNVNLDLFLKRLDLLSNLEKEFKGYTEPLEIIATEHKNVFVIRCDKKWQQSPLVFSLLSFSLRMFCYESKGSFKKLSSFFKSLLSQEGLISSADRRYLETLLNVDLSFFMKNLELILGEDVLTGLNDKRIKHVLKNLDTEESGAYSTVYFIHNRSGLISMGKTIENLEKGDSVQHGTGLSWAWNYFCLKNKIKKEKGVVIKDITHNIHKKSKQPFYRLEVISET